MTAPKPPQPVQSEPPKAAPSSRVVYQQARNGKTYPVYNKPYYDVLADELRKLSVPDREIAHMVASYKKSSGNGLQLFVKLKQKRGRL